MTLGTLPIHSPPRAFVRKLDTATEDFVRRTDGVAASIARMAGHTKNDPVAKAFITPLAEAAQALQDEIWDLYDARFLDRAPLAGLLRLANTLHIPAPDILSADALRALVDTVARASRWDGRAATLPSVLVPLGGQLIQGAANGTGGRVYFPALTEYEPRHYLAVSNALDPGGVDTIWSDAIAAPYVLGHRSADSTVPGADWPSADLAITGGGWPAAEKPNPIIAGQSAEATLGEGSFWAHFFSATSEYVGVDPETGRVISWLDAITGSALTHTGAGGSKFEDGKVWFDGGGSLESDAVGQTFVDAESGQSTVTIFVNGARISSLSEAPLSLCSVIQYHIKVANGAAHVHYGSATGYYGINSNLGLIVAVIRPDNGTITVYASSNSQVVSTSVGFTPGTLSVAEFILGNQYGTTYPNSALIQVGLSTKIPNASELEAMILHGEAASL